MMMMMIVVVVVVVVVDIEGHDARDALIVARHWCCRCCFDCLARAIEWPRVPVRRDFDDFDTCSRFARVPRVFRVTVSVGSCR